MEQDNFLITLTDNKSQLKTTTKKEKKSTHISFKPTAFLKFLTFYIFSKKAMIVIPIIGFVLSLISPIALNFANDFNGFKNLIIAPILTVLITTVIYATYSAIVIFKAMETEGIEILVCSKAVERKEAIRWRIAYFALIATLYSLLILIAVSIGTALSFKTHLFTEASYAQWIGASFFGTWFCFILFGLITAIVALITTKNIATAIVPIGFLSILLAGSFLGYIADTPINSFSILVANNSPNLNIYPFATNLSNDNYVIISKNSNNKFSENQSGLLNSSFDQVSNNAVFAKTLSWLNIPLQLAIFFNNQGIDLFNNTLVNQSNYLNNEIYQYSKNNNLVYNYKLAHNTTNITSLVDNNSILVPTLPLIESNINTTSSTNHLIYAWEFADTEAVLPIDSFFPTTDDFAGRIEWPIVKNALESNEFVDYAKLFINQAIRNNWVGERFLEGIYINTPKFFEKFNNSLTISIFNPEATSTVSNLTLTNLDRRIHLAVSLIYILYYHYNNSNILSSLFDTRSVNGNISYIPKQLKIKVDDNFNNTKNYYIGGYSQFRPVLRTLNPSSGSSSVSTSSSSSNPNVTVARVTLTKSDNNYLFHPVSDYYEIRRDGQWIENWNLAILWSFLIFILAFAIYVIYSRKEFK